VTASEPQVPGRRLALFELGFRPFYLLGAGFAAVSMGAWLAVLHGGRWSASIDALSWHQHEMVFGFALAIICGFLLTAGRAWTGLETLRRGPLALLALHWLAARILVLTGPMPLAAAVDVAFPLVVAGVMARVLIKSGSKRNLFVCALLILLAAADAAFFMEKSAVLPATGKSIAAALYLIVMLVVMIGGRIIPAFTANAVRDARVVQSRAADIAAIVLTLAAFVASLASAAAIVLAPLAASAALAQLVRQARWAPFATFTRPILWILHVSYSWIAVGLALLAGASLGLVSSAAAIHALGVGAVGGMIIAMVTRTALGHTGRTLKAGAPEITAYVLLHAGAVARLLAAVAPDLGYSALIDASGALWTVAFVIYFVAYFPRLVLPRPDGKPG
jgi:uncharacterized protein involved in response to NO